MGKKNKGGRPTKYRPEYCAALLKHMGEDGLSYETFAAVIGVNVDTLYAWEGRFPEFSEAKKTAFLKNRLFWEKAGLMGMAGKIPGFNATLWIFNMKNRHGWRDRIETENRTELTGKVNLNANVVGLIETLEGDPSSDPEDC